MSVCGVTEMQQSSQLFYGDLEEYLGEVERRAACETDGDVYSQLAQREKDLVLAAELGKALLEKNEEISRANERLAEEYSHKLEVSLCKFTNSSPLPQLRPGFDSLMRRR